MTFSRTLAGVVALAGLLACTEQEDGQDATSRSPEESKTAADLGQAALAEMGAGFLVWESNRTGSWRIWTRELGGAGLRQLTPDEPDRDHFGAHISPDGTRVAYLSYPKGSHSYLSVKKQGPVELRILRLSDGEEKVVARDAISNGQSRSVVWVDGHRLIYGARDRSTRELDLRTGQVSQLGDAPPGAHSYLLNPTKTHGTDNVPTFSAYDPEAKAFSPGPRRTGCQAYFTRDGLSGFWTTRTGGPIQRMDLASERSSVIIDNDDERLEPGFRFVYFPMVSAGQRLLAYAASGGDHDHFRVDYEVFVAPIDPATLELQGAPVRYTFDPGTDRFPDVFLAGLELGHRGGEVPFAVEIDPEHLGPEHDSGEPWRWDFGDGTTSEAAIGRHTYESPGTYALVARRGDRALHARVDVAASAPPGALRITARDREVRVAFDEPIASDTVVATLDSGIPVTQVSVDPDRHTLRVTVEDELPPADRLRLEGVRDVTGHLAPALALDFERGNWPRSREGLAFLFGTGADENRVLDPRSGREVVIPLAARGRARFDHDLAMTVEGGAFEAQGAGASLARMCPDAGAITLEALIRPKETFQEGSRLIASVETDNERWLYQLIQRSRNLRVRLRAEDAHPEISVASLESLDPIHLVVSYRDGRLVSYLNGRKVVDTDRIQGGISRMEDADLVLFGDGSEGDRDWSGTLEGIALYCRFMGEEEASANAHAYLDRVARRPEVPSKRVRAKLVAASDAPTPEEIAPYRVALSVSEWEVQEVIEGQLTQDRVRVAHWVVLGGDSQPVASLRPGVERELLLELLSDNEQTDGVVLANDLEPKPELPLFLDVGP